MKSTHKDNRKFEPDTVEPSADTQQEPEVSVFGKRINDREWNSWSSHYDAGGVLWGVLFLLSGIMLLLNSLGIVPWIFWQHIWQFWPTLLILLGLHVILGNNPVSRILLFLISLAVFGLIVLWGLRAIDSPLQTYIPSDVERILVWWEEARIQ